MVGTSWPKNLYALQREGMKGALLQVRIRANFSVTLKARSLARTHVTRTQHLLTFNFNHVEE